MAAPELSALVESCPNLRLLSTSRELLRVRGEIEYAVLPLAESEAVQLFCERAGAEADENVRGLCRALDDLPLALELAAARASVLSPKQILERLSGRLDLLKGGRDADPRQQTLRATIEWSYELLSEDERRLFARLSVFAGGCMLEAAEEVADAVLDTLQSLVDKSLLRHGNDRFWMLEMIREYASELLEQSGEAVQIGRRHAQHFLAFAEEADTDMRADRYGEWAHRLEAEHANLRLALDWAEGSGEPTFNLRLVSSLVRFWQVRGHMEEGSTWVEEALARTRDSDARMELLGAAGRFAFELGDFAHSAELLEERLKLARSAGDDLQAADSLRLLGAVVADQGQFERARILLEESLRRAHELQDARTLRAATNGLGYLYWRMGAYEQASVLGEEELALAREAGDRYWEGIALQTQGCLRSLQGDLAEARLLLRDGLQVALEVGDSVGVQMSVEWLGIVAVQQGEATRAAILFGASETLQREQQQHFISPEHHERLEQAVAATRQALGAGFERAFADGASLPLDEAVAYALEEQPGVSPAKLDTRHVVYRNDSRPGV